MSDTLFQNPLVHFPTPLRPVMAVLQPEHVRDEERKEYKKATVFSAPLPVRIQGVSPVSPAAAASHPFNADAEILDIIRGKQQRPTTAEFLVPLPRVGSSSPTADVVPTSPPARAANPFASSNSDWFSQLLRPAACAPRAAEDVLGAELGLLSLSPPLC